MKEGKWQQTYTVSALTVAGIAIVSLLYVLIPLVPYLGSAFQASVEQTVWAGSLFSIAYAVGSLIFGTLADRVVKKKLIVTGLVLLALCTFALSASTSFAMFVALRVVQGLLAASFPAAALAYVSDVLPAPARPTAISFISSGFLLAGVVGQIFAAEAAAHWGWAAVFELLGAVYAVLFAALLLLPKGVAPASGTGPRLAVAAQFRALFAKPALLVAFAAAISILLSFVAMYSGLTVYVVQQLHISSGSMLGLRAAGLLGVVCSLLCGAWIRKFGAERVLFAGFVIAAAGLVCEALLARASLPLLTAASVVFVAGIAMAIPAIISRIGVLGSEARGTALALYAFFLFVGASIGPLLAARLIAIGFAALCLVLAALLLAAAAVTLWNARRSLPAGQTAAVMRV
jgi:predicted MFS family arabinose efflux permease